MGEHATNTGTHKKNSVQFAFLDIRSVRHTQLLCDQLNVIVLSAGLRTSHCTRTLVLSMTKTVQYTYILDELTIRVTGTCYD